MTSPCGRAVRVTFCTRFPMAASNRYSHDLNAFAKYGFPRAKTPRFRDGGRGKSQAWRRGSRMRAGGNPGHEPLRSDIALGAVSCSRGGGRYRHVQSKGQTRTWAIPIGAELLRRATGGACRTHILKP